MEYLVDSNVILDIATQSSEWFEWSAGTLARLSERHAFAINAIVYAEVSVGYERIEEVEKALPTALFRRVALPWPAAFLAGKCFLAYRRRGGPRRSPLPDFYIGAHAAVAGMGLVTRDATRYRTYFPKLELVCPR